MVHSNKQHFTKSKGRKVIRTSCSNPLIGFRRSADMHDVIGTYMTAELAPMPNSALVRRYFRQMKLWICCVRNSLYREKAYIIIYYHYFFSDFVDRLPRAWNLTISSIKKIMILIFIDIISIRTFVPSSLVTQPCLIYRSKTLIYLQILKQKQVLWCII